MSNEYQTYTLVQFLELVSITDDALEFDVNLDIDNIWIPKGFIDLVGFDVESYTVPVSTFWLVREGYMVKGETL